MPWWALGLSTCKITDYVLNEQQFFKLLFHFTIIIFVTTLSLPSGVEAKTK